MVEAIGLFRKKRFSKLLIIQQRRIGRDL